MMLFFFHESTVLGAQVPNDHETDKRSEIFSLCFPDDLISDASHILNDSDGDVAYELVPVPVEEHLERTLPMISSSPKESLVVAPVPAETRSPSPAATKRKNLCRSLRNRIAPPTVQATAALSTEVVREPLSYRDALEQTYSEHWKSAMRSEFFLFNREWNMGVC